ncbi:glutathione-dependent disulfide-bond oxidoreductase [Cypionkella sp.]|jgi:GST-like protein|uniref:glutathione-dependent disulfide-bond oxidoreductase n=1 Tax=Cypionkella sp. TaxID=2811411 RepID=UPI0027269A05|nr:glutathione-dependent disulfide-bond oxidoreductase [Cypionkella sp.]MDO8984071.1 glutathione-dependent disulfide-bond oxidoreductase [Cypionkella sp.]MDP2047745.1 glutathione-dependent disulfide-bond oxidoreductase [Cypionkella sp.]
MSTTPYVPPKVWTWDAANGGQFANINRPIAGATHDKELPRGKHGFQLYSLATPNGQKVSILFEELLAAGHTAEYDAWLINISKGDQFGSGFVGVNPNSKIPALLDLTGAEPVRLFESGSMLVHLADKFGAFLPASGPARIEVINWLFWQMGSAPFVGGGFGHFFAYAPEKFEYPINRYAMETKRQLDVLDRRLAEVPFIAGEEYSIADMAIWPWYGSMVLGRSYANSAEFLDVGIYKNLKRWADVIDARPGVKRGRIVNKNWGDEAEQVPERHGPEDFAGKAV